MTKNGGIHPILLRMVFGLIFFILPFWGGEVGGREGGKNMANEPAVILQKGDNGKEISLKVGEVFEIQLEGVGGTGYGWYVRNLDTRYVDLLGEKTRAVSEGRLGGPVLGLWTFRAKEPGDTEISMDYYRQWEGIQKAGDHFQVKITIQ